MKNVFLPSSKYYTVIFYWYFKEWKLHSGIETWKHLVQVELFAYTWKQLPKAWEEKVSTWRDLIKHDFPP